MYEEWRKTSYSSRKKNRSMKTTNRRKILAFFCAMITILATFTAASVKAQSYMRVSAGYFPLYGDQQHVSDFVYAMSNNLVSYRTWTALNYSTINITNLFGDVNNGGGNALAFGFYYTNATPFTLRSIGYSVSSPFGTQSNGLVNQFGIDYGGRGVGIGADGTVYTSGNADTLVAQIFLIGSGIFFDIGTNSVASGVESFAPYGPIFNVSGGIYSNNGISQLTSVYVSVPEPRSYTFAILAGITVYFRFRKRRK
jgi:hypothetical protein